MGITYSNTQRYNLWFYQQNIRKTYPAICMICHKEWSIAGSEIMSHALGVLDLAGIKWGGPELSMFRTMIMNGTYQAIPCRKCSSSNYQIKKSKKKRKMVNKSTQT